MAKTIIHRLDIKRMNSNGRELCSINISLPKPIVGRWDQKVAKDYSLKYLNSETGDTLLVGAEGHCSFLIPG